MSVVRRFAVTSPVVRANAFVFPEHSWLFVCGAIVFPFSFVAPPLLVAALRCAYQTLLCTTNAVS